MIYYFILGKHTIGGNALQFYKSFEVSDYTQEYCQLQFAPEGNCSLGNGIFDCTNIKSFKNIPCFIKQAYFTNILLKFQTLKIPNNEEYFETVSSNKFLQEFNTELGSVKHAQFMRELTLYGTRYDLTQAKIIFYNSKCNCHIALSQFQLVNLLLLILFAYRGMSTVGHIPLMKIFLPPITWKNCP